MPVYPGAPPDFLTRSKKFGDGNGHVVAHVQHRTDSQSAFPFLALSARRERNYHRPDASNAAPLAASLGFATSPLQPAHDHSLNDPSLQYEEDGEDGQYADHCRRRDKVVFGEIYVGKTR